MAARKFFAGTGVEVVCCPTFRRVCQAVERGEADVAVMAIENTIAGSILPNYSLIDAFRFRVVGEVYLKVELCLLGVPGARLEDITVVQSHPMALIQCDEFLAASLPRAEVVEGEDTAASARKVSELAERSHAAVASRLAAEVYRLAVLAANIETDPRNHTRFLVLTGPGGRPGLPAAPPDKASLRFEVPHRAGGLAEVLEVFRAHGINLTKIQSLPLVGRPYQYAFHVDVEWDEAERYHACLAAIRHVAHRLDEYGAYPRGAW